MQADAEIDSFEELLSRVEAGSGVLADAIDVPPLSFRDARTAWQTLRQHASALTDTEQLANMFEGLQEAAQQGGRSLGSMSSLMAAGAVRAGLQMGNTYLFAFYQGALETIGKEGLPAYTKRIARPYLAAAGRHFEPGMTTYTERLLGWAHRQWQRRPFQR